MTRADVATTSGRATLGGLAAAPVAWTILCSFKTDLLSGTPVSWRIGWGLANYRDLRKDAIGAALANSLAIGAAAALLATFLGFAACVALLCGKRTQTLLLLSIPGGRLVPAMVFVLPQFFALQVLGLTETRTGLAILHAFAALPLTVVLLAPAVLRLHRQYGEPAALEGAPAGVYILRILLPALRPVLSLSFVLAFLASWTDFLYAGLVVVGQGVRTVPVVIANLLTSYATLWGRMYAAVSVAIAGSVTFACLALLFWSLRDRQRGVRIRRL